MHAKCSKRPAATIANRILEAEVVSPLAIGACYDTLDYYA